MYLIHEVMDRDHVSVHAAADYGAAAEKANELLRQHCADSGHEPEFEAEEKCPDAGKWPQALSLAGQSDGREPTGAWCNLKAGVTDHWDAHVVWLGDGERKEFLSLLLKELCRDTMQAPDSGCGDGSCENCPISDTLELMEGTWKNSTPAESEEEA